MSGSGLGGKRMNMLLDESLWSMFVVLPGCGIGEYLDALSWFRTGGLAEDLFFVALLFGDVNGLVCGSLLDIGIALILVLVSGSMVDLVGVGV